MGTLQNEVTRKEQTLYTIQGCTVRTGALDFELAQEATCTPSGVLRIVRNGIEIERDPNGGKD
jgi:hypothetical protein